MGLSARREFAPLEVLAAGIDCGYLTHQIMKMSQIAATAHASLLNPSDVGVLFSRALTAQNTARQHNDADTQVDSRS